MGHFAAQCLVKQNFQTGQFQKRPPQVRRIDEIDHERCLEKQEMTYGKMEEQINYEETAEYQTSVEDSNTSISTENEVEELTDY